MSLSELLSKKKTLEGKIEAEENRVRAIEDRKLAELNAEYVKKRVALAQWKSDCVNYLIDKPAAMRFSAMMNQLVNERAKYIMERDVAKVSRDFLARIEPKSFETLIALYELDGWFNTLNDSCDKPATAIITEKEVLQAEKVLTEYTKKINKRRTTK